MTRFTLALAFGVALVGCDAVDRDEFITVDGPAFGEEGEAFRPVSAVMEARCGTLDCHGESQRPMRIFGARGLRMPVPDPPPDYVSGSDKTPTTLEELRANYGAMCGLEPEITADVVKKKKKPETLTLVRKPRLAEKHKGGQVWSENDAGDRCLVKWLTSADEGGELDTSDCTLELQHP